MPHPTIFVSIAAYSDPVLPRTLDNCLSNARYPERLRFGICWQNDVSVPVNLDRFRTDRRFSFANYDVSESGGGCWARAISQSLWDGETYLLQVDSHMVFAAGWDETLIRMIRDLPTEKPLISTILPLFWREDDGTIRHQSGAAAVRSVKIGEWNAHLGWAPWFVPAGPILRAASRARFLSGQFVFTLGQWAEEVRQDPDHYYWGEEFALTLRSFSCGYDLYLPDEIAVWHMLHRSGPPRRHWEKGSDVVAAKNEVAFDRLRRLAFPDRAADAGSLGRYGLGNKRSLADYERFAGIDLRRKVAHPDVYVGSCPDPMTIRDEDDWARCLTFAEWSQVQGLI